MRAVQTAAGGRAPRRRAAARLAAVLLAAVLLAAAPPAARAQAPALRAALAAADLGRDPPAIAWLRRELLPRRSEWPAGLDPLGAFTLHLGKDGLRIGAPLPVPPPFAYAGEATLPGGGTVAFAGAADGREDWLAAAPGVPAALAALVASLAAAVDGPPRTIDLPALAGHLRGPAADGDPERALLDLAAARVGEVTFAVRREDSRLAVHGRSDGGLALPAVLLLLAAAAPPEGDAARWGLRAFAGRDGDRSEAARQLQRAGGDGLPPLRALLHADEPSRLAAIDGLLRLRAASELPRIVAAARADLPLATAMARTAVQELWPAASGATRAATLAALRASTALDEGAMPAPAPPPGWRHPLLAWLVLTALGGVGMLLRERARRAA